MKREDRKGKGQRKVERWRRRNDGPKGKENWGLSIVKRERLEEERGPENIC